MQIGIESGKIMVILGLLLFFGLFYAHLVNWLNRRGYSEGYTALLVVGGVFITLSASTIIHHPDPLTDLLLELACFAASGLPMVLNDTWRYMQARRVEQDKLLKEYQSD